MLTKRYPDHNDKMHTISVKYVHILDRLLESGTVRVKQSNWTTVDIKMAVYSHLRSDRIKIRLELM